MEIEIKSHENRVRRHARKRGFALRKSRASQSANNLGEFMLIDARRNVVIGGVRFDWPLDAVEAFLRG